MPSPFPGMDPYLEGYLWPDLYHSLITQVCEQLTSQLRPRYVARIRTQLVIDESPQHEIGITYPALVKVPLPEIKVRLAIVGIYETHQNQLITHIAILSPINKREPGLTKYREKWRKLREAGVHILEIDLLRRGQRPLQHPHLPQSAYRVSLVRAGRNQIHAWTLALSDPLPIVPVPLRQPDADVTLDLGVALRTIYDRAAYDLSIDYDEPPPPPTLTAEELNWIKSEVLAV